MHKKDSQARPDAASNMASSSSSRERDWMAHAANGQNYTENYKESHECGTHLTIETARVRVWQDGLKTTACGYHGEVHPAVMRIPIQLRAAPEEKAGEVRGEARRCTVETCMSASRLHMAYRCGTALGVGLGSVHGHGACVLHSLPPQREKPAHLSSSGFDAAAFAGSVLGGHARVQRGRCDCDALLGGQRGATLAHEREPRRGSARHATEPDDHVED